MKNTPQHIAIIMDGNRRWAKKNKLPILLGHKKAARETIENVADAAIKHNIKFLTLWAFSTENWDRSQKEVDDLLNLFRDVLKNGFEKLHKKGVKIQTIGDPLKFPKDIQNSIQDVIEKTKNNKNLTIIFALNYGGRDEIIRAVKKIPQNKLAALSEKDFSNYLDTTNLPDPDLIIRTGEETRLSGFLIWQSEYSELYFTSTLWPDFTPEEFSKAIEEYNSRQRRFGR